MQSKHNDFAAMRLDLYLFACVCHGVEDVVQLAATGGAFAARTSHGVPAVAVNVNVLRLAQISIWPG